MLKLLVHSTIDFLYTGIDAKSVIEFYLSTFAQ